MSRARPQPPAAKHAKPSPGDSQTEIAPPRKHPWLLALSVLLLAGWLVFMAFLAWSH